MEKPRYRWRCLCDCGIRFQDTRPRRFVCPKCGLPADWERIQTGKRRE